MDTWQAYCIIINLLTWLTVYHSLSFLMNLTESTLVPLSNTHSLSQLIPPPCLHNHFKMEHVKSAIRSRSVSKHVTDLWILFLLFQVMVMPRTGHAEDHQLQRRREVLQPQDQPPVLPQREWLGLLQLHVLECKYRNWNIRFFVEEVCRVNT